MSDKSFYTLKVTKGKSKVKIHVVANGMAHAQGQAVDILRALNGDKFDLLYGERKTHEVSELFKKLAFNEFNADDCVLWSKSHLNKNPCEYILNDRYYIRPMILKYLDIPVDKSTVKTRCKNKLCINPYHFEYHNSRNSKLTCGDLKLLVAYQGQGAAVTQLAKAFNVHPSTIYRTLNREHLHSRIADQSRV